MHFEGRGQWLVQPLKTARGRSEGVSATDILMYAVLFRRANRPLQSECIRSRNNSLTQRAETDI